jgi:hypothetical protein
VYLVHHSMLLHAALMWPPQTPHTAPAGPGYTCVQVISSRSKRIVGYLFICSCRISVFVLS